MLEFLPNSCMVHIHELSGLVSSSDQDGVQGAVWLIVLVILEIIDSECTQIMVWRKNKEWLSLEHHLFLV